MKPDSRCRPSVARLTLGLVAVTLLAACATTRQREGEISDRERYWYYAKPAVPSFSTFGRISGWRPLGRNELVVWTRFDEAYILRVSPGCFGLDSEWGIRIESRVPSTVSSGFDSVRVGRDTCRILEIHPMDYKLMKQEERELRQQKKKEKA
ncbi:MAG: DUF6491 family protein [Gammaproteobacteria bacterium]